MCIVVALATGGKRNRFKARKCVKMIDFDSNLDVFGVSPNRCILYTNACHARPPGWFPAPPRGMPLGRHTNGNP